MLFGAAALRLADRGLLLRRAPTPLASFIGHSAAFARRLALGVALAFALSGCEGCEPAAAPPGRSPTWLEPLGSVDVAEVTGLALDASGDTFLTIDFKGQLALGNTTIESQCRVARGHDLLLVRMGSVAQILWTKQFPCVDGQSLALSGDGGVVLVGAIKTPVDFGTGMLEAYGNNDVFVARFDKDGAPVFARSYLSKSSQRAGAVGVDRDGSIVIAGSFQGTLHFGGSHQEGLLASRSNLFVARLDPSGEPVWTHGYPAEVRSVPRIALDKAGNVMVAASLVRGTIDFGGGKLGDDGGFFVGKLDEKGDHVWSRAFGSDRDAVRGLAVGPAGGVVLTGETVDEVDFGAGPVGAGSDNASDPFVAAFDASGKHRFSRTFGVRSVRAMVSSALGQGVAIDGEGNIFVVGTILRGSVDLGMGRLPDDAGNYVAKLDSMGKPLWQAELSARRAADPTRHLVAVQPDGAMVVTGEATRYLSHGEASRGLFIGRFDP